MREMMKRCLTLGLSLSYVFVAGFRRRELSAPAARQPRKFPIQEAKPVPLPEPVPAPQLAASITFSGTVVRDGSRFALRDSDGALFALDSTGRAWPFEGDDVVVTGLLDQPGGLLHIRTIESIDNVRAEAV